MTRKSRWFRNDRKHTFVHFELSSSVNKYHGVLRNSIIDIKIELMNILMFLGDDQNRGDDDDEVSPSCGDYIMHFLTLFWKILFAFIPPTGKEKNEKLSFYNFISYHLISIYYFTLKKIQI